LLLFLFLGANFVFALEIDYPYLPGADPPQDFVNDPSIASEDILSLYVKYFFNLAIWAAGIIALGALIYGGIRYLASTGKPEAMVSAKDQITGAFFGLLLLLSSYLVLSVINPDLTIFKIEPLKKAQITPGTKIPFPETEEINTSIDFQMPFGRIIETIFETYFWQLPNGIAWIPRITRVQNNAEATNELADQLKSQSENLHNYADQCTCHSTDPVPRCGSKSGCGGADTEWQCGCGGSSCSEKEDCTCDPCEKVRGDIQNTEEKNKEAIYSGTEIDQIDVYGEKTTITTSLTQEQIKTEEEIRLLKEQLDRLKRAEKFIRECSSESLTSLAHFYTKKAYYEEKNWVIREDYFWYDVSNIYVEENTNTLLPDWASFYCAVSGTLQQEHPFPTPIFLEEILEEESIEKILSETIACSSEAPVGEIIDRTKKTTQLLIDKMETLVEKDRELIDAVDKLQILISQCSSERGCERRCWCQSCPCIHCHHGDCYCADTCCGYIYCCADSSTASHECLDRDEDTPCPYEEIDNQLKEIQRIHQEITDLIKGKGDNNTPQDIGILPIINEIVPEILEDLKTNVRKPMKECSIEEWEGRDVALFNCLQAEGITTPDGQVISICSYAEFLENGKIKQTAYGDCVEECYLKKGQEKYRECLHDCLYKKSEQLDNEEIANFINWLNFYCCNAGGTD